MSKEGNTKRPDDELPEDELPDDGLGKQDDFNLEPGKNYDPEDEIDQGSSGVRDDLGDLLDSNADHHFEDLEDESEEPDGGNDNSNDDFDLSDYEDKSGDTADELRAKERELSNVLSEIDAADNEQLDIEVLRNLVILAEEIERLGGSISTGVRRAQARVLTSVMSKEVQSIRALGNKVSPEDLDKLINLYNYGLAYIGIQQSEKIEAFLVKYQERFKRAEVVGSSETHPDDNELQITPMERQPYVQNQGGWFSKRLRQAKELLGSAKDRVFTKTGGIVAGSTTAAGLLYYFNPYGSAAFGGNLFTNALVPGAAIGFAHWALKRFYESSEEEHTYEARNKFAEFIRSNLPDPAVADQFADFAKNASESASTMNHINLPEEKKLLEFMQIKKKRELGNVKPMSKEALAQQCFLLFMEEIDRIKKLTTKTPDEEFIVKEFGSSTDQKKGVQHVYEVAAEYAELLSHKKEKKRGYAYAGTALTAAAATGFFAGTYGAPLLLAGGYAAGRWYLHHRNRPKDVALGKDGKLHITVAADENTNGHIMNGRLIDSVTAETPMEGAVKKYADMMQDFPSSIIRDRKINNIFKMALRWEEDLVKELEGKSSFSDPTDPSKLNASKKAVVDTKRELRITSAALITAQQKKHFLDARIKANQSKTRKLEPEIIALESEIASVNSRTSVADNDRFKTDLTSLQDELNELQKRKVEIGSPSPTKLVVPNDTRLDDIEKEILDKKKAVDEVKEKIDSLSQLIKSHETKVANLNRLKDNYEKIESETHKYEGEIISLNLGGLDQERRAADEAAMDAQKELDSFNSAIPTTLNFDNMANNPDVKRAFAIRCQQEWKKIEAKRSGSLLGAIKQNATDSGKSALGWVAGEAVTATALTVGLPLATLAAYGGVSLFAPGWAMSAINFLLPAPIFYGVPAAVGGFLYVKGLLKRSGIDLRAYVNKVITKLTTKSPSSPPPTP